jgi:hypothetical protein
MESNASSSSNNEIVEECKANLIGLFKKLCEDFKLYKIESHILEDVIITIKVNKLI